MRHLDPLVTVAAALVAAGVGVACGGDGKPQTVVALAGQTVPIAQLRSVADGLCEASRQAAATDVNAARQTFFGRSHEGLHLIARGLEEKDRADSARLLEAKQKVEADFTGAAPGAQVATDLGTLAEITRSSLGSFDVDADTCTPA